MKIAAAQLEVRLGDLNGNLAKHLDLIRKSVEVGVDLIVFPELSLTGYGLEEGRNLALTTDSPEIVQLQSIAQKNDIFIIIGAPISIEDKVYIGSFLLPPNGDTKIYTKQFLHGEENHHYSGSFNYNPTIEFKGEKLSFAICADINHEKHAKNAHDQGCTLYLASIFFTNQEMTKAHDILYGYAQRYQFKVLMSNYCGNVWNLEAGGESAIWDAEGKLVDKLNEDMTGLLMVELDELG